MTAWWRIGMVAICCCSFRTCLLSVLSSAPRSRGIVCDFGCLLQLYGFHGHTRCLWVDLHRSWSLITDRKTCRRADQSTCVCLLVCPSTTFSSFLLSCAGSRSVLAVTTKCNNGLFSLRIGGNHGRHSKGFLLGVKILYDVSFAVYSLEVLHCFLVEKMSYHSWKRSINLFLLNCHKVLGFFVSSQGHFCETTNKTSNFDMDNVIQKIHSWLAGWMDVHKHSRESPPRYCMVRINEVRGTTNKYDTKMRSEPNSCGTISKEHFSKTIRFAGEFHKRTFAENAHNIIQPKPKTSHKN